MADIKNLLNSMRSICFLLILITSVLYLSSCAYTTQTEISSADRYLKGICKEAYLSSRTSASSDGFGYQYHRYKVRAFAAANYGDEQVCAWWSGGVSQDQANFMAVSACNKRLPSGLNCVVYAQDDRIVNAPPSYPILVKKPNRENITNSQAVTVPNSSTNIENEQRRLADERRKIENDNELRRLSEERLQLAEERRKLEEIKKGIDSSKTNLKPVPLKNIQDIKHTKCVSIGITPDNKDYKTCIQ
jgi:hypothetical protein